MDNDFLEDLIFNTINKDKKSVIKILLINPNF